MHRTPFVSILMASYNHARFIGEAIDSLLAQDYEDWELIVADDASTDETLEVLSKYDDSRIRVLAFQVNRQSHMRNVARQQARGEYLAILNSDDLFLAGKLAAQVDYLERHAEVAAVFTGVRFIGEASEPVRGHWMDGLFDTTNRVRHAWLRHFFLSGNCLCLPSVMMRRESFDAVGGFDPVLVQLSDLDLWARFCLRWELCIIPEVLTAMRVLPGIANLSAPSIAHANRRMLERTRINRRYLTPEALDQATEIFPELAGLMPEPTRDWKHYLICQLASGLPDLAMRLFAFQGLQQLLGCEDSRQRLLKMHPRLMRHFLCTEGSAALRAGAAPTHWVVYLPDAAGTYCESRARRYWRETGAQTLCFSFPNPRFSQSLRVDPGDEPIALGLRGMSLYEQQSGQLIWQLSADRPGSELRLDGHSRLENDADGWTLRADGNDPQVYLPSLPLEHVEGKWLDLEINVVPVDR